jgi:site-specific DNA recombinase
VKSGGVKMVRCAIYTRVSTDHGLEQDFNSLDSQHEAAGFLNQVGETGLAGWGDRIRTRQGEN